MQRCCNPSMSYLVSLPFRDENNNGSEINPADVPLKIKYRRFSEQKEGDVRINLSHHQSGKDGKSRNMTMN